VIYALVAIAVTAMLLVAGLVLRRRRRASVPVEQELSPVVERMIGLAPTTTRRMTIPPRASFAGRLPGPGVLEVAGVQLPAGRPTRPIRSAGAAVEQLWSSSSSGEALAASWKPLAAGFTETGLWPMLLHTTPSASDAVQWFDDDADRSAGSETLDVAEAFATRLAISLSGGSPLTSTDLLAGSAVARGQLGRGSGRRTDAVDAALGQIADARLALVPCRRPADAVEVLVWPGAVDAGIPERELADLLASWEERYGALLVALGEHSLLLAILRPPTTLEEAVEALAEQHALCPDEADGWGSDEQAALALIDAPVWTLSWH
jgi:hypothetical protein